MSLSNPGPLQPGYLRVGDVDRSTAADLLGTAFADGRLTRDEYDTRLNAALSAKTVNDLRTATQDLVPAARQGDVRHAESVRAPERMPPPTSEDVDRTMALFAGIERAGVWRVAPRLRNISVFGGSSFDFRDAVFETSVVEFNVGVVFGGVDIRIPRGVDVRNETIAVFGGASMKRIAPTPGAPTIVLKGLVLFGGVNVKGSKT